MNPVKQMSEDLLGMGRAKGTIAIYAGIARKFLKDVDEEPDRHDALRFLGGMREITKGSTRRVTHYALRALYESMGLEFGIPSPKDNSPREISRPMLAKAEVDRLITWAKEDGTPCEKAFLALSTLYGLRRSELIALRDVDIEDSRIMIWTLKGGEPKRHVMPDCIAPAIYGYNDWATLCATSASMLFKAILIQAGLGVRKGYGWHSIRRCLVTELLRSGVNLLFINKYLRWRGGRTPLLGMDGALAMPSVYAQFEESEVDEMVFQKHPFLKSWEKQ